MISANKLAKRMFNMDVADGLQDKEKWNDLSTKEFNHYIMEAKSYIDDSSSNDPCSDIPEDIKNLFAEAE